MPTAAAQADTGAQRLREWQALLAELAPAEEREQIAAINRYFNRTIAFAEDKTTRGRPDHWASPRETLALGRGDCEDYAIAKYFSLRRLGVASDRLWLTYVMLRIGQPGSHVEQAHMVLAYYPTPTSEALILDNMLSSLQPASQRPDLRPVFRFNSDALHIGAVRHPPHTLPGWRRVLREVGAGRE